MKPHLANAHLESLQEEILHEKAATLGRLGRRLEVALAELARLEDERGECATTEDQHREQLAVAGEALWCYVIQRELYGLVSLDTVVRELGIPARVLVRMGPRAIDTNRRQPVRRSR